MSKQQIVFDITLCETALLDKGSLYTCRPYPHFQGDNFAIHALSEIFVHTLSRQPQQQIFHSPTNCPLQRIPER